MRRKRHFGAMRRHLPYLYMSPTMIWILFFMIYPLVFALVMAFKRFKMQAGLSFFDMPWVGLGNFIDAFTDQFFLISIQKTFTFLLLALSIEFALGLGIALLLNRKRGIKLDYIWITLILTPLMFPLIASGNVWRMLLDTRWGLINALIMALGFDSVNFLGDTTNAFIAILIVEVWQWTPFVVIILLAGLRSLPVEPMEAALVDGASKWQVFYRIILPLLSPQILVVLLIRGMDIFKTFDFVYSLTFGGPGQSTTLVSFYIYRQAFVQFKLGYGAALSWITFVIIYIIAFLILKFIRPKDMTL
jgi:multiple sugar transport system permease protein